MTSPLAILAAVILNVAPQSTDALLERLMQGVSPAESDVESGKPSAAQIGDWVTYRSDSSSGSPLFIRLAAVASQGQEGIWLELEAGLEVGLREPLVQLKLLCERGLEGLSGKIVRAIAVVGHGAPREVDPRRWSGSDAQKGLAPSGFHWAQAGRRVVSTALGSLAVRPWELRFQDRVVQRLYLSAHVPLLHLVRLEVPEAGQTLELQASGTGATPRVQLPRSPMSVEGLPKQVVE
jgi:hypothetical protein